MLTKIRLSIKQKSGQTLQEFECRTKHPGTKHPMPFFATPDKTSRIDLPPRTKHPMLFCHPGVAKMAWDVMSGVTKTAWDVMSGVTKTAWDVMSGVANLCGMFCRGVKKWHGMFCLGMFCPAPQDFTFTEFGHS